MPIRPPILILALLGLGLIATPMVSHASASEAHGAFSLRVTKKYEVPIPRLPLNVVWSADGSRLAVESDYWQTVTVLDASGTKLSHIFHITDSTFHNILAFVDGSSHVLTHPTGKSDSGTALEMRDVSTGHVVKQIEGIPSEQVTNRNAPNVLAVSRDQRLAAVSMGAHTIILYDTKDWHKLHVIQLEKNVVFSLCFSSDGKKLVIGYIDGFAMVDTASGRTIRKVEAYHSDYGTSDIESIALSPSDDLLLTIAGGGLIHGNVNQAKAIAWSLSQDVIRIWRVSDGALVTSFGTLAPKIIKRPIRQGVWDPKGQYVAFIDANSKLFLWQALNGDGFKTIDLPSPAESLAISPDGKALAVAQGTGITVFNIE